MENLKMMKIEFSHEKCDCVCACMEKKRENGIIILLSGEQYVKVFPW